MDIHFSGKDYGVFDGFEMKYQKTPKPQNEAFSHVHITTSFFSSTMYKT